MPQDTTALLAFEAACQAQDWATAKALAQTYCDGHPDLSDKWHGLSIPSLVSLIDDYRAEGREADRMEVDVWLMANHEPQEITGSVG